MTWVFLLAEFVILFLTSQFIFKSLHNLFYKIFKNNKVGVVSLAIIFFPGVVIHELSHFLIAELLFVKTHEIEFMPEIIGDEVKMGSIQISKTDIFRRMMIGSSPVVVGSIFISSILFYFLNAIRIENAFSTPFLSVQTILIVWMVFVTANTMFSSKKDLEGVLEFLLLVLFISLTLVIVSTLLKIEFVSVLQSIISNEKIVGVAGQAAGLLAIPVFLNVVISLLALVVKKR